MAENYVLRERARRQLGGRIFGSMWLKMMAVLLIISLLESAASMVFYIGALFVAGPLTYAIERICANRAKNTEEVNFNRIFDGFSEDYLSTLVLGLLSSLFIALWSLLLIIPGIIKSYSYSMAFFIQQEQPNKNWKYNIDQSRRLMNGKKWKLFCLDFSFIGWYLLGFLCLGVGILFVIPYHQMARANFFLEVYYAGENQEDLEYLEDTQEDDEY